MKTKTSSYERAQRLGYRFLRHISDPVEAAEIAALTTMARNALDVVDRARVPPLLPIEPGARRLLSPFEILSPPSDITSESRRRLERVATSPIDGQHLTHDEILCALIDALKIVKNRRVW